MTIFFLLSFVSVLVAVGFSIAWAVTAFSSRRRGR
jgi:hypothetical protein